MGRRHRLARWSRRHARSALDRGAHSLDRAGTLVRDRLRRSGPVEVPPPTVESVAPAGDARASESGEAVATGAQVAPASAQPLGTGAEDETAADERAFDLSGLTKAELYRLAREHDIPGRSKLTKDELVRALESS